MELAAGDWQQVLTQQCGLDLLTPAGIEAQSYPSYSCSHTRACTDCLLTCCGDVSSGGANRLNLILYKLHIHLQTFKGALFGNFPQGLLEHVCRGQKLKQCPLCDHSGLFHVVLCFLFMWSEEVIHISHVCLPMVLLALAHVWAVSTPKQLGAF